MPQEDRNPSRQKRRRKRQRHRSKPAPTRSTFDPDLPVTEPLSPDEVADMVAHLSFLRRYRAVMRLKLNAKEARLVEASEPPTHRGTCKHLLAKIDRTAIESALRRKPLADDDAARAAFLAGAAGISRDIGVLINYLEALAVLPSRRDAVRAFHAAVRQIDFTQLSAARLSRLLEVMRTAFLDEEHPGALFELLRSESFRAGFDTHTAALHPTVAEAFVPLRSLHEGLAAPAGSATRSRPETCRGLARVLSAPHRTLRHYAPTVRRAMLELALEQDARTAASSDVIWFLAASLKELNTDNLALRLARAGAAVGRYKEAYRVLENIDEPHALTLREHLARPRLGPYALLESPSGESLQPAFCLLRLAPVWLKVSTAPATEIDAQWKWRRAEAIPGVTCVIAVGTEADATWMAFPARLARAADLPSHMGLEEAAMMAADGIRLIHALHTRGMTLPDVHPHRFLFDGSGARPHLQLTDLSGLRPAGDVAIWGDALSFIWVRSALAWPPLHGDVLRRDLPDELTQVLAGTPPPRGELLALLDGIRDEAYPR